MRVSPFFSSVYVTMSFRILPLSLEWSVLFLLRAERENR